MLKIFWYFPEKKVFYAHIFSIDLKPPRCLIKNILEKKIEKKISPHQPQHTQGKIQNN